MSLLNTPIEYSQFWGKNSNYLSELYWESDVCKPRDQLMKGVQSCGFELLLLIKHNEPFYISCSLNHVSHEGYPDVIPSTVLDLSGAGKRYKVISSCLGFY